MFAFSRSPECKQTTDPPVAFRVDKKSRGKGEFNISILFLFSGMWESSEESWIEKSIFVFDLFFRFDSPDDLYK